MRKRIGNSSAGFQVGSRFKPFGVAVAILGGIAGTASLFLSGGTGGAGTAWAPWGKAEAQLATDDLVSDSSSLDLFALLPEGDVSVGVSVAPQPSASSRASVAGKSSSSAKKPRGDEPRDESIIEVPVVPITAPSVPPTLTPSPSPSESPDPSPSPSPTDGGEDPPLVPVTPPDAESAINQVVSAAQDVIDQVGEVYLAVYQKISELTGGLVPPLPTEGEVRAQIDALISQAPTTDEVKTQVEEIAPDTPTTEEILATVDGLTPDVPTAEELEDLVVGSIPEEVKVLVGRLQSMALALIELGMDIVFGDGSKPWLDLVEQAKTENVDPAVGTVTTVSGEVYATATAVAADASEKAQDQIDAAIFAVTGTVGAAEELRKGAEETVRDRLVQTNELIDSTRESLEDPPSSLEIVSTVVINSADPVGTIVNLAEGHSYRFVVKGTYRYAVGSSLDMEADATCARKLVLTTGEITGYQQDAYTVAAGETPYENALEVSVSTLPLANEHADWQPAGDDDGTGCSASHAYTLDHLGGQPVGPGQAGQLHFRVIDWNNAYTDNVGTLTLEVHDTVPVPAPTSSDVTAGVAGWILLASILPMARRKSRGGLTRG